MIKNRAMVSNIRKYMPDNRVLNKFLAQVKLYQFDRELIPEKYRDEGENNPSEIPAIVERFEKKRPGLVNNLSRKYDAYLRKAGITFSPREYQDTRTDVLFHCLAYGFAPDEYFFFRIKDRTTEEKRAYFTETDRKKLQYIMSNFKDLQYVFDKAATYEKFREYYKRDAVCVTDKNDYNSFREFAGKHDWLVIKQVSASCGQGIQLEKAEKDDLQSQFERITAGGKCLIEEKIEQAEIMSRFNTSSVNTLRVISFHTRKGIQIGPCFIRTGRPGSFVDNGGAGGMFAGVDSQTGVVCSDGYDEFLHRYEQHPSSGVVYKGFRLPDWEKCMGLVREMCLRIPRVGYIGWDLAYTKKGWVLIEANGGSQFIVNQIINDCGCRKEIEQYIAERNTI